MTPPKTIADALQLLLSETRRRVEAGTRSRGTLAMHEQHARYLLERIGPETPVRRLTERMVEAVLEDEARGRRKRSDGSVRALSGGTMRKRACTLRRALVLSHRKGWLRRVPEFPELAYRYQPKGEHLPSFQSYAKLRDALPPHRRLWFALAVWTGQRFSDVERMRREDFAPDYQAVRLRSTKTYVGPRWFHAPPELVRELEAHWRTLPEGAKLVEAWPHVSSQLTRLSERLKLPRMTAQRLRHTWYTWYVAANGFNAELLEHGGWRDMTVPSRVYAHAAPKRLQEQIERTHELIVGDRRAPRKASRKREPAAVPAMMPSDGSGGTSVAAEVPPRPARAHGSRVLAGGAAGQSPDTASVTPAARRVDSRVGVERIELSTNGLRGGLLKENAQLHPSRTETRGRVPSARSTPHGHDPAGSPRVASP
jgi:integrase